MNWGLHDVEDVARGKLSRMAYDYAAGGAGEEMTLRENVQRFHRYRLRARMMVDVSKRDTGIELLGRRHPVPFGIAPTAFHKLFHPDGERGTARAAAKRGILHCVSTLANTPLHEVAQEGAPRWFQLYIHKDRALTEEMVRNAENNGYEALVLTVDVPVQGVRERDRRNRFELPPNLRLANMRQSPVQADEELDGLSAYIHTQFDPSLTWDDLDWLRSITTLPVLVKGILTAEDAQLALDHGAAGIIVSNHGARQLDRVPSTLDALPEIVQAVSTRAPVMMDGGIRRGIDILIALAMGANFVLVGRPIVWGIAAGGELGAGRVLDLLSQEVDNAMALCGKRSIDEIGPDLLLRV